MASITKSWQGGNGIHYFKLLACLDNGEGNCNRLIWKFHELELHVRSRVYFKKKKNKKEKCLK